MTTFVLIYEMSFATFVIFMVGNAFFSPVFRICYTSYMYRLISELPSGGKKLKTELIATRQIFLTIGRILPIGLFMMFAVGVDYNLIAWILVITSLTQCVLYFVMIEKHGVLKAYNRYLSG